MKIFFKIFKIFLQSVVFLFLFLSVFIVVTSKTNLLAGIKSFVVLTGSMEPALPAGSVVFIRPSDNYRTGDVISFKNSSGMTVTHRIVASSNGYIRTAGDANNTPDSELLVPADILGKAGFSLPLFGRLAIFTKSPAGFIGMLVVPALFFIAWQIFEIIREVQKLTEKRILSRLGISPS